MRLISLTLVFISLQVSAGELTLQQIKQDFLTKTQLKTGAIDLIKGPEECELETLELVEIQQLNNLTLKLGAEMLVPAIGSQPTQVIDRDCKMHIKTTYADRSINYVSVQSCELKKISIKTTRTVNLITFLENNQTGFEFTRTIKSQSKDSQGKVQERKSQMTCRYRFT